MNKFVVLFLLGILCFGCVKMFEQKKSSPIVSPKIDNFQDIDNKAQEANAEYKVPFSVILWATEGEK